MARTRTQIRQLTANQLGLRFTTGTADSGGSTTTLKDTVLQAYNDDTLIGAFIFLTSGSPTFTEMVITTNAQSTGVATFRPTLGAAPDTLTYEILPFTATDIHQAMDEATLKLYDQGWLIRKFTSYLMGGSPLYNADWSYWTSASVVDGWTRGGTGTIAREVDSANIGPEHTSLKLSTVADYVGLDQKWQNFLEDFRNNTVKLYCPVKANNTTHARIGLNVSGTVTYSPYHGGDGSWELLGTGDISIPYTSTSATIQPRLYNDGTNAVYFGMPFIVGPHINAYPLPVGVMPNGPTDIKVYSAGQWSKDAIASNRGRVAFNNYGRRGISYSDYHIIRHHDENNTGLTGVLEYLKNSPPVGSRIILEADGPLTIPTINTDNIELNYSESLLLATQAAIILLDKAKMRVPHSTAMKYQARIEALILQLSQLAGGVGQRRGSAALPLRW